MKLIWRVYNVRRVKRRHSKELEKLIKQDNHAYIRSMNSGVDYQYIQAKNDDNLQDRKKLIEKKTKVIDLIIELLRYQDW